MEKTEAKIELRFYFLPAENPSAVVERNKAYPKTNAEELNLAPGMTGFLSNCKIVCNLPDNWLTHSFTAFDTVWRLMNKFKR